MNTKKRKSSKTIIIVIVALLIIGAFGTCFIGILAAIAIPNFLEAQVRSKVARTKFELRSLNTALEVYKLDHQVYPPNSAFDGDNTWLGVLSNQQLYLQDDQWYDVFSSGQDRIRYFTIENDPGYPSDFPTLIIYSAGPDTKYDLVIDSNGKLKGVNTLNGLINMQYDSTNGTISNGDIIRIP